MSGMVVVPSKMSVLAIEALLNRGADSIGREVTNDGLDKINFKYYSIEAGEEIVEAFLDLADKLDVKFVFTLLRGPDKHLPCSHNYMTYHQGKFTCALCGTEIEVEN